MLVRHTFSLKSEERRIGRDDMKIPTAPVGLERLESGPHQYDVRMGVPDK
jgi:hypothetical protein